MASQPKVSKYQNSKKFLWGIGVVLCTLKDVKILNNTKERGPTSLTFNGCFNSFEFKNLYCDETR